MVFRILVVDDDVKNLDITTRLLQFRNYQVITAGDGAQALARAKAEKPDLILMDLKMPTMDGYEATWRLKADQQTRSIPIIAVSASAMDEQIEKASNAGCDEYVSKPIVWERLYDKIDLLLSEVAPCESRAGGPLGEAANVPGESAAPSAAGDTLPPGGPFGAKKKHAKKRSKTPGKGAPR